MDNIGCCLEHGTYRLKCTYDDCGYDEKITYMHNTYEPKMIEYGKKVECPKCGLHTAEVMVVSSFLTDDPEAMNRVKEYFNGK